MYGPRKGKNVLIITVYVVHRRGGYSRFLFSGDGDDRGIFLGFEIFNSGFFWVGIFSVA